MTNAHAERHAAQRVITLELEQARLLRCHIAGRSGDSGAPLGRGESFARRVRCRTASEPEDAQSFLATSGAGDGDANHGALAEEDDSDDAPPPPMPTVLSISHGDLALVRVTLCRVRAGEPTTHEPATDHAPAPPLRARRHNTRRAKVCSSRLISAARNAFAGCSRFRCTRANAIAGTLSGGSSAESLGDGGGEIAHETLVTSCQRDIDLSNPEEQREKVSAHGKRRGRESTGIAPHTCSFVRSRSRACFGSRPRRRYRSRRAS